MCGNRGKYADLIDDEIWDFIDRSNRCYPPQITDLSIEKHRDIYNAMCREFFAGHPPGVRTSDGAIEFEDRAVSFRNYKKTDAAPNCRVIYLHGGGFIVGGLDSHDDICAELCQRTGYLVTSIDYRLAPEYMHPAAFEDALAAFRHFARPGDFPIVLLGDSAGANLAAAVCHAARQNEKKPIGQVLIYPELGGPAQGGSYSEHAQAPLLTTKDAIFYKKIRGGGEELLTDPTHSPLDDTDFSNLPSTFIQCAQCDPLAEDGVRYRDKILGAGGLATCIVENGLVHGHLRARHSASRAGEAFNEIVAAVGALGKGERYPG